MANCNVLQKLVSICITVNLREPSFHAKLWISWKRIFEKDAVPSVFSFLEHFKKGVQRNELQWKGLLIPHQTLLLLWIKNTRKWTTHIHQIFHQEKWKQILRKRLGTKQRTNKLWARNFQKEKTIKGLM